jgi:hypothetical protein
MVPERVLKIIGIQKEGPAFRPIQDPSMSVDIVGNTQWLEYE